MNLICVCEFKVYTYEFIYTNSYTYKFMHKIRIYIYIYIYMNSDICSQRNSDSQGCCLRLEVFRLPIRRIRLGPHPGG